MLVKALSLPMLRSGKSLSLHIFDFVHALDTLFEVQGVEVSYTPPFFITLHGPKLRMTCVASLALHALALFCISIFVECGV